MSDLVAFCALAAVGFVLMSIGFAPYLTRGEAVILMAAGIVFAGCGVAAVLGPWLGWWE